jgi:hypothetical protein
MANVITFNDLLQCAADLGQQAGAGVDTQVKFLLKSVEGGYHNALDLKPSKHGTDIDDATKLAETYVKARQGAVVFDAKADNQQKLISTIRTSIKLGAWPKGGNGEPLATVNNLMTMRQNLKKIPAQAKQLDDAANTLLKYARTQLKRDTLLSDDELKQLCFKKKADTKTVEELVESAKKALDKLIDGSAAGGTAQCNTQHVVRARHELQQQLADFAKAKNPQHLKAV